MPGPQQAKMAESKEPGMALPTLYLPPQRYRLAEFKVLSLG